MSHTSKYGVKMKNLKALQNACEEVGAKYRETNSVRLFAGNQKCVAAIQLPGWRYEIAVKENGELFYDHFGSAANTMAYFGKLAQAYHEEVIVEEAMGEVSNYYVDELENGDKQIVLEYDS